MLCHALVADLEVDNALEAGWEEVWAAMERGIVNDPDSDIGAAEVTAIARLCTPVVPVAICVRTRTFMLVNWDHDDSVGVV